MKLFLKFALSLFTAIIIISCNDDGVVKPTTTPSTAVVDPAKGCFLKSSTYDNDDAIKVTYDSKNQVEKLVLGSFFDQVIADFTYNTDGTVANIKSDDINYQFVYDKAVLTKILEKDGQDIIGERIVTLSAGKPTAIAYYSLEGTVKTLEYTHKFTYTKGNVSKYVLNIFKTDIDFVSDVVYDTKLNHMTKLSKATDAYLLALTDNFLYMPSESILNFGSVNNFTAGKFRPEILSYLFSLEESDAITTAALNKEAPLLSFTNTILYSTDNYPTSNTLKYKDPVDGDISLASKYTYDCK